MSNFNPLDEWQVKDTLTDTIYNVQGIRPAEMGDAHYIMVSRVSDGKGLGGLEFDPNYCQHLEWIRKEPAPN